ncbi:MAG: hypothetical protein ACFFAS_00170 [Promethearchaeota archaeon]
MALIAIIAIVASLGSLYIWNEFFNTKLNVDDEDDVPDKDMPSILSFSPSIHITIREDAS